MRTKKNDLKYNPVKLGKRKKKEIDVKWQRRVDFLFLFCLFLFVFFVGFVFLLRIPLRCIASMIDGLSVGFHRVLPGFTGFYQVLPGFTGFLLGLTGFY